MSEQAHAKHTHRVACGNVVPGCGFTATADSEEAILAKVAAHARDAHRVTEVSPELAAKVKSAIERQ